MRPAKQVDVTVIGGGPAGLAAAIAAGEKGASVLLVEREAWLGGILKQCIHDGFGLLRFGEKLSGPEYAQRYVEKLKTTNVEALLLTFATRVEKAGDVFSLTLVGSDGITPVHTKALVLATGCRERTARQVAIHGTRPAGVYTAGSAQYYTNILGQKPVKRCVVLGSGDIGLIMARRLTLEGCEVLGVYEAKPTPSGLSRNIAQCLHDFDIPLYTGKTVTRVFGEGRLTAVEISDVDENMQPIVGTQEVLACDGLILSVGLLPENELAESLGVPLDPKTKGPVCDQSYMTAVSGVFSCGNAMHVNDLVDYVSESGAVAGTAAAEYAAGHEGCLIGLEADASLLYLVPQKLDITVQADTLVCFFRSREDMAKTELRVTLDDKEVYKKRFAVLRPPEMERVEIPLDEAVFTPASKLSFSLKALEGGG